MMIVKVSVALLGAKGFGKSSFLKRGVGRIYRRVKGVIGDRKRLDDYNDVSIAPTNEKEPLARCVYKSRKEEPGFEISFFEYAGELAAKEIDAGIKGTCLRLMYNWFFAWLPENCCPRWLSAIALAYKIKSADAAIVMLPADLDKYDSPEDDDESQTGGRTNAEREGKPPRYDLGSFRTNIESWLSKSKGRPMFVAINKCDKLAKDEIENFSKVFKKRMLGEIYRNLCDTIGENQIGKVMISISPRKSGDSFMEKLDDKEKIKEFEKDAPGLSPFGIKEMIESVVARVNHVRAENVKKAWETAGWLRKAFVVPFVSLKSLIRGTTDQDVLKINASGWIRFFSMCFAIILVAFLIVLGVCCLLEYKSEKEFQGRLEIQASDLSILTPNDFKCNDEFLTQSTWVRPLFFSGRIGDLRDKADGVRRDFIAWLENDLTNSLNGVRVQRLNPWDVEPRVNIERSTLRMNLISNHFILFTQRQIFQILLNISNRHISKLINILIANFYSQNF